MHFSKKQQTKFGDQINLVKQIEDDVHVMQIKKSLLDKKVRENVTDILILENKCKDIQAAVNQQKSATSGMREIIQDSFPKMELEIVRLTQEINLLE